MKKIKIGDIFEVKIDQDRKKYFQYIAKDQSQLNSDVIRAFDLEADINEDVSLSQVLSSSISFYTHTNLKLGLNLNLWDFFDNSQNIGTTDNIVFRFTDDYTERDIKTSKNWWVWKINEDFKFIGLLSDKYKTSEIGLVFSPYSVVERLSTGKMVNFPN